MKYFSAPFTKKNIEKQCFELSQTYNLKNGTDPKIIREIRDELARAIMIGTTKALDAKIPKRRKFIPGQKKSRRKISIKKSYTVNYKININSSDVLKIAKTIVRLFK